MGGQIAAARENREEAVAALERLEDAQLADRLEIFYYLAWAENFIQEPELALRHGRAWPRGLASNCPGTSARAASARAGVPARGARPDGRGRGSWRGGARGGAHVSQPQYLFWALWEVRLRAHARGWSGACAGALRGVRRASEGLARNFLSWPQPGATYGAPDPGRRARTRGGGGGRGIRWPGCADTGRLRAASRLVGGGGGLAGRRPHRRGCALRRAHRTRRGGARPRASWAVAAQARAALLLATGTPRRRCPWHRRDTRWPVAAGCGSTLPTCVRLEVSAARARPP